MPAKIKGHSNVFTFTPTNDTNAYSSGDVIGTVQEITNCFLKENGVNTLVTVLALDKANQKAAIDLVFFHTTPANSIGADNAAYGLNDADIDKVVGRLSIAAADYVSSGSNNAEATVGQKAIMMEASGSSRSLFVAAISRGTPTYGASGDIYFKLGFYQE